MRLSSYERSENSLILILHHVELETPALRIYSHVYLTFVPMLCCSAITVAGRKRGDYTMIYHIAPRARHKCSIIHDIEPDSKFDKNTALRILYHANLRRLQVCQYTSQHNNAKRVNSPV